MPSRGHRRPRRGQRLRSEALADELREHAYRHDCAPLAVRATVIACER